MSINKEVVIIGYSNITPKGLTLHTNISAKLKTGNVKGKSVWVSWNKIGKSLFEDYTQKTEVAEIRELRGENS